MRLSIGSDPRLPNGLAIKIYILISIPWSGLDSYHKQDLCRAFLYKNGFACFFASDTLSLRLGSSSRLVFCGST